MPNSPLPSLEIPAASPTCTFAESAAGGIECQECGRHLPGWTGKHPVAVCHGRQAEPQPEAKPVQPSGPGTNLKSMLKWIGIRAAPGCSCNKRAKHMDDMGAEWCRQNIETILGWLKEEADKRKLPFVREAVRPMVLLAISRSEKAAERMARRTAAPT